MFNVYVIINERGKIYIGQTSNIDNRLRRHNRVLKSKAKSYTNINKGNWKLIYKEEYCFRKEAVKRDKQLKSSRGREKLQEKSV